MEHLPSCTLGAQVTKWFIVAVAAVGGTLALTGGLLGPAAGEAVGGGSSSGGSSAGGSTGLGIGCLGLVLAAQVGRSCMSAGNRMCLAPSERTAAARALCGHAILHVQLSHRSR